MCLMMLSLLIRKVARFPKQRPVFGFRAPAQAVGHPTKEQPMSKLMVARSLIGYLSCSITLRRLAPPKLFDYKERDFHRSNSPIDQTLDKRKSFTVDEANVFQVKSELDSFLQCQLGGLA